MPDSLMIAAYVAQLRLAGYARSEECVSAGQYRVSFVNAEELGESHRFDGMGGTPREAERAAVGAYLEWARTGGGGRSS